MFGIRYDLLCYEQSDLDELKRARIVAEFDNGESPESPRETMC